MYLKKKRGWHLHRWCKYHGRIHCLPGIKVVVINNTGRHFFIVIHIQERGKKALDRAVKIINFTQPQFWVRVFLILLWKNMYKAALLYTKEVMAISLCNCWELNSPFYFKMKYCSCLKEAMVIQTWVFGKTFLKKNEVSLSLQGKQLTVLWPMIKIELSS